MQAEETLTQVPPPPAPAPVYRCENPSCGHVIGFIDHGELHVVVDGLVVARISDGTAYCMVCRSPKQWYVAEWRMQKLLRQRQRAQAI